MDDISRFVTAGEVVVHPCIFGPRVPTILACHDPVVGTVYVKEVLNILAVIVLGAETLGLIA